MFAPLAATLVQLAISRTREYEADRQGSLISGHPLWLASALGKLEEGARAIENPTADGHPASAQLFLDFLLSGAGQQALCAAGFEASQNNFTPTNGCTASLTELFKTVPASHVYLVPFSKDVLRQQASITARWNAAFHRNG